MALDIQRNVRIWLESLQDANRLGNKEERRMMVEKSRSEETNSHLVLSHSSRIRRILANEYHYNAVFIPPVFCFCSKGSETFPK
jgi:hypothetical protein